MPEIGSFDSNSKEKSDQLSKTQTNLNILKGLKYAQGQLIRNIIPSAIEHNLSQEYVSDYIVNWRALTNRLANINTSIAQLLTVHEE